MNYIDNYNEKNPKAMKSLPWILIIVLILSVGVSIWVNMRPGVSVGELFLYRKSSEYYTDGSNEMKMLEQDGVLVFDLMLNGDNKTAKLKQDGDKRSITFENGETISGTWGIWFEEERLLDEKGLPIALSDEFSISVGGEELNHSISNTVLAESVCRVAAGYKETRGSWGVIIIGIIIYFLGMACFYFPEKTILLFTRWKYNYVEMSDLALMLEKVGGIAIMILGIVCILQIIPF